ncbi:MAG TPA: sigma-70 family RNA polymerase sigma factor, partial [Chthoniobacterales bacterium]|nr:sigma-70 family RNA polymerase sigma factor [Chthoniobacterales bacterium]
SFSQNRADTELVRQMQGGDEEACAAFYDRFAPGLFSIIYAILRDQTEAEDVLQESLVQMWKRSATYDSNRSDLFTWAVMIARHRAIERSRQRQRQARLVDPVTSGNTIVSSAPPPVPADAILPHNRAALAQMGDAQREAIDLAFFGGLTQTEISERLGAPLGTVRASIRRALLVLREGLEGVAS